MPDETTQDLHELGRAIAAHDGRLSTRIGTHFRRRFLWLFVLALLAIVSGYMMLEYEEVLTGENGIFLLALFLPMVIAAGGNTGGQASTMVIRALALSELRSGDAMKVAWKELRLIGALLPLGARAIKLDPAVIAAPAITTVIAAPAITTVVDVTGIITVVDVTGMIIHFTVARALLGL